MKGFTLNDDRFKSGSSMNYFNELQDRIREIRLSEKISTKKLKTATPPVSTTSQKT
ncbi:RhuM family protein [Algoriphagus antarcticus]|uniref:RhuM family protein n=1 Tax=Algoriphagus antarcticus TaxID=238540 RepID=UPI001F0A7AD0